MQSKKLGRAAAVAGLIVLLAPGAALASWWDGGYDGRNDNSGYDNRSDTSPDYGPGPGESPPADDSPPPGDTQAPPPSRQCGQGDCYNSPPTTRQCGQGDCYNSPPTTRQCGQGDCYAPPPSSPPRCAQPTCGAPPPPPPPPVAPIYGCENSDLEGTALALHKETTPPGGTPVAPGDEILVDITWRVTDWSAPFLHKALDCVYINGVFVPGLSYGEHDTPNDGHFAVSYIVPLDAPLGGTICDQGFVSGPSGWEEYFREVSNVVCFPIDLPPPPPPPACCAPPPVETTTTTAPEAQPVTDVDRIEYEAPEETPTVLPEQREVLPRTGSGPDAARLAAGGLALLTLIRRRTRRG